QYVHEFFRGWESAGSNSILAGSKDIIPSQLIQNVGLTYESLLKSVKLSYTFQIQNLMNDRNFDFFGVQKPGRAFYFKLTTQF
ncbi:MAG: ligand-gated channel protein, partial [Bacteroidota bacterium]